MRCQIRGSIKGVGQIRIVECATIGPCTVLVFDGPLPFTEWRAIVVDNVRYDTLPVMDAGNNCLAIVGTHDMTGKDAIFVESILGQSYMKPATSHREGRLSRFRIASRNR